MEKVLLYTSVLLMALWLAIAVAGCATSGELLAFKKQVRQSLVEQTESLESHKMQTSLHFDALKSDLRKAFQNLKADYTRKVDGMRNEIENLSNELTGLQGRVADLDTKSSSLVQEREKVHATLEAATRQILFLFRTEESEIKDRIRFLQEATKEYGANGILARQPVNTSESATISK